MVHSLLFFYFAAKVEPPKKMKNCQAREFPIVIIGINNDNIIIVLPAGAKESPKITLTTNCESKINPIAAGILIVIINLVII